MFGELTVTVVDVATAKEAQFIIGSKPRSWKAPDGGKLALFKLAAVNDDITEHEAPAFNLQNYDTLKEDPNTLYLTGINDIRVYGGNEGAVLPDLGYQSLGIDGINVYGRQLYVYSNGVGDIGPAVGPNTTHEGWVWGLIEDDQAPALRIQTENNTAQWKYDDVSSSIKPDQGRTIEM